MVIYELIARKKRIASLKEEAAQRKADIEAERQKYLERVFDDGEDKYGVVLEIVQRRVGDDGG